MCIVIRTHWILEGFSKIILAWLNWTLKGDESVTGKGAPWQKLPLLSLITAAVQVTIGGKAAEVTYQGLAPGFAGLAQLNVIVPSGLMPGDQPVFVTLNGVPSNAGVISVK